MTGPNRSAVWVWAGFLGALVAAGGCKRAVSATSNRLVVARPTDAVSLDPARTSDIESLEVAGEEYGRLVRFSAGRLEPEKRSRDRLDGRRGRRDLDLPTPTFVLVDARRATTGHLPRATNTQQAPLDDPARPPRGRTTPSGARAAGREARRTRGSGDRRRSGPLPPTSVGRVARTTTRYPVRPRGARSKLLAEAVAGRCVRPRARRCKLVQPRRRPRPVPRAAPTRVARDHPGVRSPRSASRPTCS